MPFPRLCLVSTLFLLPLSNALLGQRVVESQVQSVSLFRDGARVTRSAEIEAPAGKSTLRFESLPTNVDTTALVASIGEATGVIRTAKLFRPQTSGESEAVRALQKRLEAHRRQLRETEEEASIARARIKFVEALSESFADGYGDIADSGASLDLEQGLKTWELVDRTRREAQAIIEDVNEQLAALNETEVELQRELREAQERQYLTQTVAEVEIELDRAQALTISISYQALSARWQPQYELRAEPEQGKLAFGYFAAVWQQTGEDWSGVELSLHTNQTNRRGKVPELGAMRLQRAAGERYGQEDSLQLSPFAVDAKAEPAYRATSSMAGSRTQSELAAPPPPSEQSIAVTASSVSFQVTLPAKATVPSSPDPTTLAVTRKEFDTEFWSETVPKLQLDAYLRAKASNTLDLPILPGQGLAFVDGALSSKVALEKTLPGEDLELSLGVDANLVVKRVEGAQEDKQSGFLDKTVTLARSYTNTVASYHATPHKIVVVDQFPIATDTKIEISRRSPKESAVVVKEENKDNGIFHWEATIEPQKTLSFTTEYTVVHPRDWPIAPTP